MSLKTPERSAKWEVISVELLGVAKRKDPVVIRTGAI